MSVPETNWCETWSLPNEASLRNKLEYYTQPLTLQASLILSQEISPFFSTDFKIRTTFRWFTVRFQNSLYRHFAIESVPDPLKAYGFFVFLVQISGVGGWVSRNPNIVKWTLPNYEFGLIVLQMHTVVCLL